LLFKYLWKYLASFSKNPMRLLLPCFFNSISKCWHIYWTIFGRSSSVYLQGSRYKYIKATGHHFSCKTWQASSVLQENFNCYSINSERAQCRGNNSGHRSLWLGLKLCYYTAEWLWVYLTSSWLAFLICQTQNCLKNQVTKCFEDFCWKRILTLQIKHTF
jgi:hypothetical protein